MKVLQIVPEMHVGGVETGTLDLAKALVHAGHDAFVISHGGVLVQELQNAGVRHFQMPVHKKSLWTLIRMIFKVRRFIRMQDIDIIHARSRVPAWIAFFASIKTQARFVSTVHGHYSPHFFSRIVGCAESVIAISSAIRDHCIQKLRIDASRIKVIPRGVDLAHLTRRFDIFKEDIVRIGIVGRLVPLKGHDVFLQAIHLLEKKYPKIRAYIIGEPATGKETYFATLKKMVADLGLEEKIVFMEGKRNLEEIYQHLDVLVLSSVKPEGF
ncbi:MAG: glycosyltransferase, partial [Chlamydiota bacterium]|nr:glycosyltransferase [Chlamydiota bacterium]